MGSRHHQPGCYRTSVVIVIEQLVVSAKVVDLALSVWTDVLVAVRERLSWAVCYRGVENCPTTCACGKSNSVNHVHRQDVFSISH